MVKVTITAFILAMIGGLLCHALGSYLSLELMHVKFLGLITGLCVYAGYYSPEFERVMKERRKEKDLGKEEG